MCTWHIYPRQLWTNLNDCLLMLHTWFQIWRMSESSGFIWIPLTLLLVWLEEDHFSSAVPATGSHYGVHMKTCFIHQCQFILSVGLQEHESGQVCIPAGLAISCLGTCIADIPACRRQCISFISVYMIQMVDQSMKCS